MDLGGQSAGGGYGSVCPPFCRSRARLEALGHIVEDIANIRRPFSGRRRTGSTTWPRPIPWVPSPKSARTSPLKPVTPSLRATRWSSAETTLWLPAPSRVPPWPPPGQNTRRWIDAHGDLNTPGSSPSATSTGCRLPLFRTWRPRSPASPAPVPALDSSRRTRRSSRPRRSRTRTHLSLESERVYNAFLTNAESAPSWTTL